MSSILDSICIEKQKHVQAQKQRTSLQSLLDKVDHKNEPREFYKTLKREVDAGRVGLIAEMKKASPSKGLIRENYDPVEITRAYETAMVTCISVLTDTPFFQGSDKDLKLVSGISDDIPILRKDFIFDPYQVVESRALGADCILLMMSVVPDIMQARIIEGRARDIGLDVLIEVSNESELENALKLQSKLIGINNRDLTTMKIDPSTVERLAPQIPSDYTIVCESGIKGPEDIQRVRKNANVHAFLVGGYLMEQNDIIAATEELM